jgi:hypothetical protein
MELHVLPGEYSICSLPPEDPIPDWSLNEGFNAILHTPSELSIVCPSDQVPPGITQEASWKCLEIAGPLEFTLVGILAEVLAPLTTAGIPVFVLSSYKTDYIMVKREQLNRALESLQAAGHTVHAHL